MFCVFTTAYLLGPYIWEGPLRSKEMSDHYKIQDSGKSEREQRGVQS